MEGPQVFRCMESRGARAEWSVNAIRNRALPGPQFDREQSMVEQGAGWERRAVRKWDVRKEAWWAVMMSSLLASSEVF